MKTYIINIEHGTQIRIDCEDINMKIHDKLISFLDNCDIVELIKTVNTFETPISDYKYKGIPFSVLFDEMLDETFVFVGKEYDYTIIESLLQKCNITNN